MIGELPAGLIFDLATGISREPRAVRHPGEEVTDGVSVHGILQLVLSPSALAYASGWCALWRSKWCTNPTRKRGRTRIPRLRVGLELGPNRRL